MLLNNVTLKSVSHFLSSFLQKYLEIIHYLFTHPRNYVQSVFSTLPFFNIQPSYPTAMYDLHDMGKQIERERNTGKNSNIFRSILNRQEEKISLANQIKMK